MSDQLTIEQGEALLQAINQHVFLVKLSISWPKMQYQIADAVVEVNDDSGNKVQVAKEYRNNPQWVLMPPEWHTRFTRIEGQARSCLSKASFSFGTGGLATIAVRRADEVFQRLRQYRDTMYAYRDEFVELYSTLLSDLQRDITSKLTRDVAEKALSKLPSLDQIRGKFNMSWAIVPVGNSSINRVHLEQLQDIKGSLYQLSDEVSDKANQRTRILDAISELGRIIREASGTPQQLSDSEASEFVQEARRQMAEYAQEFVQTISRGPREQLAAALNHLLEATRQQRNIQNGSIEAVRRACQMVRDFAFMQDEELLRLVDTVDREVENATPRQFNSDSVFASQFAEAVAPAIDACSSAERALRNERQFTRLVLRKRPQQPAEVA